MEEDTVDKDRDSVILVLRYERGELKALLYEWINRCYFAKAC
jgi:hypothetical protein